ncbi:MAG: putative metal-dependent TIM-barrel fold hydrolase [Phycisphaerales bacterium]|jgi:predicted metal-dependent TIM-barrel fold hydrolase
MAYIDPHIHMVSRTTDDYQRMAQAGCVAITEPAFWAGFDRSSAQGFYDYFRQLTDTEPKRAEQYGIKHHCWLCINPKESEDVGFAREVISIIPEFIECNTVLGIGEIGLNKNSKNELLILEEQLALAERLNQLVLVHTPHLEDKFKGTQLIMDAIENTSLQPDRVLIDHVEEHTIRSVLDRGYWAGMTLYPDSKCTPQRAADIIEMHGTERLWINSAGDWGPSDPLAVPKCQVELASRGHSKSLIETISYDNPLTFLSKSGKFKVE